MSCVDGLLRRRSLISIGDGVKYAVTAASNPDFMAALYANGYALNPEYMTMEEAAALTTETLGNDITDCEHVDLRYFVNFNGSLSNSATHRLKRVTMPNVSDRNPLKVNWCFWPVEGVVLTIPNKVTRLDPWFINSSPLEFAKIICEPSTPPSISSGRRTVLNTASKNIYIYVPDASLSLYQASAFWNQYYLLPMSEYDENFLFKYSVKSTDSFELTPVSFDASTNMLEVVDCPSGVSEDTPTLFFISPTAENKSMPKRGGNYLLRVDSTHVKIVNGDGTDDVYTFSNYANIDFDGFTVITRYGVTTNNYLSRLFSKPDYYYFELIGRHFYTTSGNALKFIVANYQGVEIGLPVSGSNIPMCNTSQKSLGYIDLKNKSIILTEMETKTYYAPLINNHYTSSLVTTQSNDVTEKVFTANPNNYLALSFNGGIGDVLKVYRVPSDENFVNEPIKLITKNTSSGYNVWGGNLSFVDRMFVDNVEVTPVQNYTFEDNNEHEVLIYVNTKLKVPDKAMWLENVALLVDIPSQFISIGSESLRNLGNVSPSSVLIIRSTTMPYIGQYNQYGQTLCDLYVPQALISNYTSLNLGFRSINAIEGSIYEINNNN